MSSNLTTSTFVKGATWVPVSSVGSARENVRGLGLLELTNTNIFCPFFEVITPELLSHVNRYVARG